MTTKQSPSDALRAGPLLPDPDDPELNVGFDLSEDESNIVRRAMRIHLDSRRPRLTWAGWHTIATALDIGVQHAMEISRRPRDHQGYRLIYTPFLKSTGLTHLGKDDIAAATRLLPHWGEIDDWRSSLPISYQEQLNNPRSVEKAWKRERGREIVPVSRARIPGHHRESPSLLEEKVALENQLQAEREQAEFRESELHAVIQELAKRYSIDDDTLSEITAEVRARYEEK